MSRIPVSILCFIATVTLFVDGPSAFADYSIEVVARTSAGTPLPVADINAVLLFDAAWNEVDRREPINVNPIYLSPHPPGDYYIHVYCWDMVGVEKGPFYHGNTVTRVGANANPKRPLTVRVYYGDGTTPLSNASVHLDSWNGQYGNWTERTSGSTGSDGRVTLDAYPTTFAGEKYRVRVRYNGSQVGSNSSVTLSNSSSGTTVSVTTSESVPNYSIEVFAQTSTGDPLPVGDMNAVLLFDEVWQEVDRRQPVNVNPIYLSPHPPGDYYVHVYCWDMVGVEKGPFYHGNSVTRVEPRSNPKRPLTATVFHNDGSTLLQSASVHLDSWNGQYGNWTQRASGSTGTSGQVTLNAYPTTFPGEKYRVRVTDGGALVGLEDNVTLANSPGGCSVSATTSLEPPDHTYSVTLHSDPSGADVRWHNCTGTIVGTTPVTLTGQAGNIAFYFTKAGYECYDDLVITPNDDGQTITITLTPDASEDGAQIVSFVPPTSVPLRGTQAESTVRVANTGTTTRRFWVGLSLATPGAGAWPEGWLDVPPIATAVLTPGSEQELTFSFEVFWWLPSGDYDAVAAVWAGFDGHTNLMVAPRYDDASSSMFFLDAYLPEDVNERWLQDSQAVNDIPPTGLVFDSYYELPSWFGTETLPGPRIVIRRGTADSEFHLEIDKSPPLGDSPKVKEFFGGQSLLCSNTLTLVASRVFVIVPASAEIIEVVPAVLDGTTLLESTGNELIGLLFFPISGELQTVSQFLAEQLAEEAASTVWREALGGMMPYQLPYSEVRANELKVLQVDVAGVTTFDDLMLRLKISCDPGEQIGLLVDLDYSMESLGATLVNLLLGPGSECAKVKEFRAAWAIDCAAIGNGDADHSAPAFIETESGDDTMTFASFRDEAGVVTLSPQALSIRNETDSTIDWQASSDQGWLGLALAEGTLRRFAKTDAWRQYVEGTLGGGEALEVLVKIDDSALSSGEHRGSLVVRAGDSEKRISIVARIMKEGGADDAQGGSEDTSRNDEETTQDESAGLETSSVEPVESRGSSGACGAMGMLSFALLFMGLAAMRFAVRSRRRTEDDARDRMHE